MLDETLEFLRASIVCSGRLKPCVKLTATRCSPRVTSRHIRTHTIEIRGDNRRHCANKKRPAVSPSLKSVWTFAESIARRFPMKGITEAQYLATTGAEAKLK